MARQYLNLADVYGAVDQSRAAQAQLQNQQLQQQRYQMEMQQAQRAQAEQDAIKGIYRGAIETDETGAPILNEKRLVGDLLGVAPEQGLKMQESFRSRDADAAKAQSLAKKEELAHKVESVKYVRNLMPGVRDQATYDTFLQTAADTAPDLVKSAPREYNPDWVNSQLYTAEDFIKKGENELNRGVQLRGQDITVRGQDLTDSRTRSEGAANRNVQLRGQNLTDVRAREKNSIDAAAVGYSTKPLPATALKMQNEGLDKLSIASNNNAQLGKVLNQLETGKLNLGLASNIEGAARNYTGMSNESSRNLSSFKSTLEKLRNDSLRLNTGVQTDGDAQRAWNELFENINDKELVKQRLGEIQEINKRGADLQKLQVENIRGNYNAAPIDFAKYEVKAPPTAPAAPPKAATNRPPVPIKSEADYNKLPKGTVYLAPDGTKRTKQ